jgi:hypothetical protein
VSTAMENILLKIKPPPKNLQTDNGKEFFQSLMKKHKINHYSTFSSIKASIVGTGCKRHTCHLQQHFFDISEPNKGTKGPENHSLD